MRGRERYVTSARTERERMGTKANNGERSGLDNWINPCDRVDGIAMRSNGDAMARVRSNARRGMKK